jgi:hypothetical protein
MNNTNDCPDCDPHNLNPQMNLSQGLENAGGAIVNQNGEAINPLDPDLFKVHKIEKTPEAWENFSKNIRNKLLFHSFSIVDKGDHLEVYFI